MAEIDASASFAYSAACIESETRSLPKNPAGVNVAAVPPRTAMTASPSSIFGTGDGRLGSCAPRCSRRCRPTPTSSCASVGPPKASPDIRASSADAVGGGWITLPRDASPNGLSPPPAMSDEPPPPRSSSPKAIPPTLPRSDWGTGSPKPLPRCSGGGSGSSSSPNAPPPAWPASGGATDEKGFSSKSELSGVPSRSGWCGAKLGDRAAGGSLIGERFDEAGARGSSSSPKSSAEPNAGGGCPPNAGGND